MNFSLSSSSSDDILSKYVDTFKNKYCAANDYTYTKYDFPSISKHSTFHPTRNEDSASRLVRNKTGAGSESTDLNNQSLSGTTNYLSPRYGTGSYWNPYHSSNSHVDTDFGLSGHKTGAGYSSACTRTGKPVTELGFTHSNSGDKYWRLGGISQASPDLGSSRAKAGRNSSSFRSTSKDFGSSRRRGWHARTGTDAAEHKAATSHRPDARRSSVRPSRAGLLGSSGHHQGGASRSCHRPLSAEDLERQKIAEENKAIVKSGKFPLDLKNVETVTDADHVLIKTQLQIASLSAARRGGHVTVRSETSIGAAISCHMSNPHSRICVLSFADAHQAGGGYLRGRGAQEETLCRQTLLYPTIRGNLMYTLNKGCRNGCASDVMIYSPNVYVIRDDSYDKIGHPFMVNIISAAAVDNRSGDVTNSAKLMEERIRKIVRLAAARKNDVLILGAFGCGVFKNDPNKISAIFKKVLNDEGMKNYFTDVIFPIKDSKMSMIFHKALY